ncbi:MAG TPA: hypothetical protein VFH65_30250 [Mycobacterium sp.]|nr:hypothetical protein [Mycobacterium sp.]
MVTYLEQEDTLLRGVEIGGAWRTAIRYICNAFRATLPARTIGGGTDGVAEPITELGKPHHAWLPERRLPSALDHHEHP